MIWGHVVRATMPLLHELVYALRYIPNFPYPDAPVLARHEPFHASALKPPPEAGCVAERALRTSLPMILTVIYISGENPTFK